MKKFLNYVTGDPYAMRLNGISIGLSDVHKYNEPLIIKDQYGWRDGGRPRDVRIIFPPFESYTVVEKGDLYTVGRYTIVSSNVVGLIKYILDNPGIFDDLDFYIKNKLIDAALSDAGWINHYDFLKKEDQYTNCETGEVVVGTMNAMKKMDLDREFNRLQSRIKIMDE